jgi:hypothetical protein
MKDIVANVPWSRVEAVLIVLIIGLIVVARIQHYVRKALTRTCERCGRRLRRQFLKEQKTKKPRLSREVSLFKKVFAWLDYWFGPREYTCLTVARCDHCRRAFPEKPFYVRTFSSWRRIWHWRQFRPSKVQSDVWKYLQDCARKRATGGME